MPEIHIVEPGDTLNKIAIQYGLRVNGILAINPEIEDPDLIFVGQQINIPDHPESRRDSDSKTGSTETDPSVPAWMSAAEGELGVTEIAGTIDNPRIVEYHATTLLRATDDETPWCSSFVNWCIERSGIDGTDSARARSWLKWGRELDSPKKGCVVVFSRPPGPASGHVGFFAEEQHNHIVVLGGNQKNSVNYSSYPKARLLGYRWPD